MMSTNLFLGCCAIETLTIVEMVSLALLLLGLNYALYRVCRAYKQYKTNELVRLRNEADAKRIVVTDEELKQEIQPKSKFIWSISILICLDIWVIGAILTHVWAVVFFNEVAEGDSNKALFGDSFGAVNALISAFAFAGMLVAFFLQRYELRLQRKELQLTRDEMKDQTKQFEEQNKTLRIQRFENTFFNMMSLQQQIVSELKYATKQIVELKTTTSKEERGYSTQETPIEMEITGRNLFSWAFLKMPHTVRIGAEPFPKETGMKAVLTKYGMKEYVNQKSATLFDHYFRHLYTILKFIDKYDLPNDNRILTDEELYGYAKILRATLSRYELVWLYYNGLSGYGNKKLKPLLEKYCMLKNLREELLVCCKDNQETLNKIGVTLEQVQNDDYSGTDYEFFLTTERNNEGKYHYSAFYKSLDEQNECIQHISNWNAYLDDKTRRATMKN